MAQYELSGGELMTTSDVEGVVVPEDLDRPMVKLMFPANVPDPSSLVFTNVTAIVNTVREIRRLTQQVSSASFEEDIEL